MPSVYSDSVQSMNLTGGCAIQALAAADSPSYKELQKKFGSSKELIESARSIITSKEAPAAVADLTSRVEAAKQVSACSYETGTSWGQEVCIRFNTVCPVPSLAYISHHA